MSKGIWQFSKVDGGALSGSDDANTEMFKKHPMVSLTREICQNSIDAALNDDAPVVVEFSTFNMPISKIPGFEDLKETVKQKYEFVKAENMNTDIEIMERINTIFQNSNDITILKVSDKNTKGVTIDKTNDNANGTFASLVKTDGASFKGAGNAGSRGIGKQAAFNVSDINTVFYSSLSSQGEGFVGSSKLCSHQTEQGIYSPVYSNKGYFETDEHKPVKSLLYFENYEHGERRVERGLDIYIMAFDKVGVEKSKQPWYQDIIKTVLKDFMLSIYKQKLQIKIIDEAKGIDINSQSLESIITEHCIESNKDNKQIQLQYLTLTTPEHKEEVKINGDKDLSYALYALNYKSKKSRTNFYSMFANSLITIDEDSSKSLFYVRNPYMLIKNKVPKAINTLPICAVCVIDNNQLNSRLRKLENPQHTDWNSNKKDDPESCELLKDFEDSIVSKLQEWYGDENVDRIDFQGLLSSFSVDDEQDNVFPDKIKITQEIVKKPFVEHNSVNATGEDSLQQVPTMDEDGELTDSHMYQNQPTESKNNSELIEENGVKVQKVPANMYQCYNIAVDQSAGKYDLYLNYNGDKDIKLSLTKINAIDALDEDLHINRAYIDNVELPVVDNKYICVSANSNRDIMITYEVDETELFTSEVSIYEY